MNSRLTPTHFEEVPSNHTNSFFKSPEFSQRSFRHDSQNQSSKRSLHEQVPPSSRKQCKSQQRKQKWMDDLLTLKSEIQDLRRIANMNQSQTTKHQDGKEGFGEGCQIDQLTQNVMIEEILTLKKEISQQRVEMTGYNDCVKAKDSMIQELQGKCFEMEKGRKGLEAKLRLAEQRLLIEQQKNEELQQVIKGLEQQLGSYSAKEAEKLESVQRLNSFGSQVIQEESFSRNKDSLLKEDSNTMKRVGSYRSQKASSDRRSFQIQQQQQQKENYSSNCCQKKESQRKESQRNGGGGGGYRPLFTRVSGRNESQRGLEQNKAKREEVSSYLDESSFIMSNAFVSMKDLQKIENLEKCNSLLQFTNEGNKGEEREHMRQELGTIQPLNLSMIQNEKSAVRTAVSHYRGPLRVHRPQPLQDPDSSSFLYVDLDQPEIMPASSTLPKQSAAATQVLLQGNQSEGSGEDLLKLFPDRMIKAAAFIDMMNTSSSQLDSSFYRIRDSKRRKAQDVEFAQFERDQLMCRVQELVSQLKEAGIDLDIQKVKEFTYEIRNVMEYENEREVNRVVKLGLSGNSLMIRTGGGYYDFLEYLQRKQLFRSHLAL